MSVLAWRDGRRLLTCRVCEFAGDGVLVAEVTPSHCPAFEVVRCPDCESLQLLDEPLDWSPTDAVVDQYVESGAGIGTIAEVLGYVDPRGVRRFLDVGCNFGFAMDVARFLFGWEVVGVEPSLAGVRGAAALELDIRHEYLTTNSSLGEFDLVLASEVLEHVPHPVQFLSAIRTALAPGGSVVLTTPAAEIVSPASSEIVALSALSPGYHVFLATSTGLQTLLRRAGFTSIEVMRNAGSLRAVASCSVAEPAAANPEPISEEQLTSYYRMRALSAEASSVLGSGMATRYLRSAVATGDFREATEAREIAVHCMRERHGIDLADFDATLALLRQDRVVPGHLPGTAFALGMIELVDADQPQGAARYFTIARVSAELLARSMEVMDLDVADITFQAEYHRLLALTRFDPVRALDEAAQLPLFTDLAAPWARSTVGARQCRLYAELVARDIFAVHSELAAAVGKHAPLLAESVDEEERMAALDALYSLGLAHLRSGARVEARQWLNLCLRSCEVNPSDRSRQLASLAQSQLSPHASRGWRILRRRR